MYLSVCLGNLCTFHFLARDFQLFCLGTGHPYHLCGPFTEFAQTVIHLAYVHSGNDWAGLSCPRAFQERMWLLMKSGLLWELKKINKWKVQKVFSLECWCMQKMWFTFILQSITVIKCSYPNTHSAAFTLSSFIELWLRLCYKCPNTVFQGWPIRFVGAVGKGGKYCYRPSFITAIDSINSLFISPVVSLL